MSRSPFSGHVPVLDGIRGLAIAMVLAVHFIGDFPGDSRPEQALAHLFTYGTLGVDLFFVLSGFLITGILFDAKGAKHYFRNFYVRRTLRIFPLYYGVLAVAFFLVPLVPAFRGPTLDELLRRQGWAWAYAVNIYIAREGAWTLPYLGHFWSLAVEEHFYLFWPLVVWLCPRPLLLKVCLALVVGSVALRIGLNLAGVNALAPYTLTPCRFDALCIGAWMAVKVRGEGGRDEKVAWLERLSLRLGGAALAFVLVSYAWNRYSPAGHGVLRPLREMCFAFIFAGLLARTVAAAPGTRLARFFTSKTMTFLGKYSYGLYVFHAVLQYGIMQQDLLGAVKQVVPWHLPAVLVQAALATGVSAVLSMISFRFYEQPFLRLKERFEAKG